MTAATANDRAAGTRKAGTETFRLKSSVTGTSTGDKAAAALRLAAAEVNMVGGGDANSVGGRDNVMEGDPK